MKAIFLSLLLFYSCDEHSKLVTNAVGLQVQGARMDISQVQEAEWKIGKRKETEVSQGFSFILNMPKIKQEDLEYLIQTKGVDAWMIRVIQVKPSGSQDLGSLYTLFKPQHVSRGISSGAATSVGIKIYYAAAYASERFRSLQCPMFGHDKKIKEVEIQGEDSPFDIVLGQAISYKEKSQLVQLAPSSFNGGNELRGSFHLEIAAYDSKNKVIYGGFKRLPRYVEVTNETIEDVGSCNGVRVE